MNDLGSVRRWLTISMAGLLQRWRVVVSVFSLMAVAVVSPHWDFAAFALLVAFSTLPVLCWLVAAPSSTAAAAVGFALAFLSVVPGFVLGPGGLSMFRVVPGGPWVAVLYLPLGMLTVAIVAPALARRMPSQATMHFQTAKRTTTAAWLSMTIALTCGCGCGALEAHAENSELPTTPTAAIIGMLPAGLTVVGEPDWHGGSSVSAMSYNISSTRGQSTDEIADKLSIFIAELTGWPVPPGFGSRCYRAAGFISYSGRFCLSISEDESRVDSVELTVGAWDGRFGGFSPLPG